MKEIILKFSYKLGAKCRIVRREHNIRENFASLSFEEGPYHMEKFPYHYYAPEKMLLDKEDLQNMKSISTDIETLLIELNI